MTATCSTCRYWDSIEKECRRNPPTPFPMPHVNALTGKPEAMVLALRPPTPAGGWCGEHSAKGDA